MVGLADTVIIAVQVPLPMGGEATVVSDAVFHAPPPCRLSHRRPFNLNLRRKFQRSRQLRFSPQPIQRHVLRHRHHLRHHNMRRSMRRLRLITRRPTLPTTNAALSHRARLSGAAVGGDAGGFVAWSFIDCKSFSSVFPVLFPPFSCT